MSAAPPIGTPLSQLSPESDFPKSAATRRLIRPPPHHIPPLMDSNTWTGPEPPIINAEGAIEYVRPYDHEVRRATYANAQARLPRRYSTPPPPSLVLTRHIETPADIFDTDEDEDNHFATQVLADADQPPAVNTPERALADIPPEIAQQLGFLGTDPARYPLATQLLNLPEEHRWPLTVMTLVQDHPARAESRPSLRPRRAAQNDPVDPERMRGRPHIFSVRLQVSPTQHPYLPGATRSPMLASYAQQNQISNSVRLILLSGDIECYSNQRNRRARGIRHTPLTIILGRIRTAYRIGTIDPTMMPRGYAQMCPQAMNALSSPHPQPNSPANTSPTLQLLENIVPFDHLDGHGPVPRLGDLMQSMWEAFQTEARRHLGPMPLQPAYNSDRVRMAHIRLHMIDYRYSTPASSYSYWTTLDRDLLALAQEDDTYQAAHAQAILMRDAQLFDGSNTLASIPRADRRLPSDTEIQERLALIEAGAILLE
ncbi:hypothetical protein PGTUg99_020990 [Puccinia graminis f. sp. tritici]|uniref:Uncharacterized protein n=1 Tax=Puccinia graminis f. sp. tritici TaxID=56615 RepID=A0A5B0RGF9_PUCGR|nr:hypothetical protein PGTUg99_020990 [Puccinia graminis f. sp. tritici]